MAVAVGSLIDHKTVVNGEEGSRVPLEEYRTSVACVDTNDNIDLAPDATEIVDGKGAWIGHATNSG